MVSLPSEMGTLSDGSPTILNKWESYQMGALPYKTSGNYKRREPYRQTRIIADCILLKQSVIVLEVVL